jgi:hypothetical protein
VLLASSTRYKSVTTSCGLVLAGAVTYRTLRGPIDTLLVAGGTGAESVTVMKHCFSGCERQLNEYAASGPSVPGPFYSLQLGFWTANVLRHIGSGQRSWQNGLSTQLWIQTQSTYAMETPTPVQGLQPAWILRWLWWKRTWGHRWP